MLPRSSFARAKRHSTRRPASSRRAAFLPRPPSVSRTSFRSWPQRILAPMTW
ncbi:UNVERIFIED_CONTAM: hypothetical protein GTU68_033642 [Idotea baltica]|nr:hypothetical protein [Idotea baltica]